MTTAPALTFRLIAADELDGLLALYRDLAPDDPPVPAERAAEVFRQLLDARDTEVWVADEGGGDLVATCVLITVPNLSRGARPHAIIENVVTRADRRQRGIGLALMRHVIDVALGRDCYKIMLQTGSSRESTHAFYRKLGFRDGVKTAYVIRDEGVPQVKY